MNNRDDPTSGGQFSNQFEFLNDIRDNNTVITREEVSTDGDVLGKEIEEMVNNSSEHQKSISELGNSHNKEGETEVQHMEWEINTCPLSFTKLLRFRLRGI